MSISLDLALYLREQKDSDLTLCERGVLFTLFFRVGSNAFSWISQEVLADELQISARQLKRQIQSLLKKGFIQVLHDPKDLRKNLYRPANFLINYHQNPNRKTTKNVTNNKPEKMENRGHKCHKNYADRGHKCHINRGQDCHLISDDEINTDAVVEVKNEVSQIPKAKEQSNNKSKDKYSETSKNDAQESNFFDEFWKIYPKKKDKIKAHKAWIKNKCDKIANEIIEDVRDRHARDEQWRNITYIPHPSTYLNGKRWEDDIIEHIKTEEEKEKEFLDSIEESDLF